MGLFTPGGDGSGWDQCVVIQAQIYFKMGNSHLVVGSAQEPLYSST